jgi:hypothetical protein
MADNKKSEQAKDVQPVQPAQTAQQVSEQQAAIRQEAAERKLDEAKREGGEYIVNDVRVDANGQPIKSRAQDRERQD